MISAQQAMNKAQEAKLRTQQLQEKANRELLSEINGQIINAYEKGKFEFTYPYVINNDVRKTLEQNGYTVKTVSTDWNESGTEISFENPTN